MHKNSYKPHTAVIKNFHISIPVSQVPIQYNARKSNTESLWNTWEDNKPGFRGWEFFTAKDHPQNLFGIGTNWCIITKIPSEYNRQGVPSEKSTQILKCRSCLKMKTWSWLGVALASRERRLAEQWEFSFEKKKKSQVSVMGPVPNQGKTKIFPWTTVRKNDVVQETLPHTEYLQPKATVPGGTCASYSGHKEQVYEPGGLVEKGDATPVRLFVFLGFVWFGRDVFLVSRDLSQCKLH